MSWSLCSSYAAITKAGAYSNSTAIASAALLQDFSDKAEGQICMKTRKDWVSTPSSQTQIINAIADATSDLIAMKIINYDHSGYLKGEAQTMLDVLKDNSDTIIKDLRQDPNQVLNK